MKNVQVDTYEKVIFFEIVERILLVTRVFPRNNRVWAHVTEI